MSDSLRVDLTVSTTKAEKSAEAFAKKVEKRFGKIEIGADAHANTRAFDKLRKEYDKNDKAFERLMKRMKDLRDKDLADAKRAAIERGKVWEDAARKREAIEKRQLRDGEAHAKAIEQQLKKEGEQRRKFYADRRTLLEDFQHRAHLTAIQYGQQDERTLQQHQRRLVEIQKQGSTMRLADMRRQMEIANVEFARSQQKQAQQKQQYTLFGTSFSNKANQGLFMAQQAIEDFSYAGLRGATNNLAMMAASMGGPGGLIALGTVLGVTVLPTIAKATGLVSDEFMDSTKAIQRVNDSLERFVSTRDKLFQEAQSKNQLGRSTASMFGDLVGGQQSQAHMQVELNNIRERKALIESLYRTMYEVNNRDVFGVSFASDSAKKQLEGIKQALRDRHGMTDDDFADIEGMGIRSGWLSSAESGVIDPIKKRQKDLENEIRLQEELNKKAQERLIILGKVNLRQTLIERSLDKQFDTEKGVNDLSLKGGASKAYGSLLDDISFRRSHRTSELQGILGVRVGALLADRERAGTDAEKARIMEKIVRLQNEYYNAVSRINGVEQGHVDKLNEKRNLIATIQDKTQQGIEDAEKQIDAEKRLQEQIKERIKSLEKARTAQAESFAESNFQSSLAISGKQFDEEMERFNAQEEQNFGAIDQRLQWAKRMGYDTSGAEQYYGNMRSQRREFFEQNLKSRRQAEKRRLGNEYEASLQDRAKRYQGDPESQLNALRELEGYQRSRIGSASSSTEMRRYDEAAKQTQQRILELMAKMKAKEEEELAKSEERQKKEEARLATLNAVMNQLKATNIFEASEAALGRIMQQLSGLGIDLGAVGAAAGAPQASAKGGAPSVASSTQTTNYNVNVAGIPQRPSLTMREVATMAANQAKAQAMRQGMA